MTKQTLLSWMEGRKDGQMDGWVGGWMHGWGGWVGEGGGGCGERTGTSALAEEAPSNAMQSPAVGLSPGCTEVERMMVCGQDTGSPAVDGG